MMDHAETCHPGVNDAGTCVKSGTELTQPRSLGVHARNIARIYPKLSPALKPLATVLQQQCRNYERNPEALRPLILATIDRISAVTAIQV